MFGIDYSSFSELIEKIESLGITVDEAADKALNAVSPLAKETYKSMVPYDSKEKDSIHARNNVNVSRTRTGADGRYRLVGVFIGGAKLDWSVGQYLFYVENGTSKMPAYPFMDAAAEATASAVEPQMKSVIEAEVASRLG